MIEELLQEMLEKHGNEWPKETLARLLDLGVVTRPTQEETEELWLLHKWALEMIEAGIAFKQPHALEEKNNDD